MSLEQAEILRQKDEDRRRAELTAKGYHREAPFDVESQHSAIRAYWKKGPYYCGSWCGCRAAL